MSEIGNKKLGRLHFVLLVRETYRRVLKRKSGIIVEPPSEVSVPACAIEEQETSS